MFYGAYPPFSLSGWLPMATPRQSRHAQHAIHGHSLSVVLHIRASGEGVHTYTRQYVHTDTYTCSRCPCKVQRWKAFYSHTVPSPPHLRVCCNFNQGGGEVKHIVLLGENSIRDTHPLLMCTVQLFFTC